MAYPGMFFAVALGISLGVAAYYFLTGQQRNNAHANSNYTYDHHDGGYDNEYTSTGWQPRNENDETRRKINKECTICLTSIGNAQRKTLGCNHSFHHKCIEQWLQQSATCPICRRYERM